MPLNQAQLRFLTATSAFFAVQFLPHQFTSLQHSPLAYIYMLVVAIFIPGLLFAAAVVSVAWLLSKDPTKWQSRCNWLVTFVLTLVTIIAITTASAVYARGLPTGSFVKPYSREIWLASSSQSAQGDISERQKMLGAVIRTVVRGGHKDNIIEQLGPSEDSSFFASSGRDLIYNTGRQRDSAFPIDSEWLLIWFDENGRTSRYEIWSD